MPVATLPIDGDITPVINKLDELLGQRDDAGVKTFVSAIIDGYNRHLKAALLNKYHQLKNQGEGVSTKQLVELFKGFEFVLAKEADSADQKLKNKVLPEEEDAEKPKHQPPRKRDIPSHLPVVANSIAVPESERACPSCGQTRQCIGHDTTKIIDLEPARIIVREDIREKLKCKACPGDEIVRAPLGDKVIEGGSYGSRLVGDLLKSKYDDGLPLERQRQRLLSYGLDMPAASMGDQITWATDLLKPIARGLFEAVLQAHNLHMDATGLPVRDKDSDKGIKVGALWGYVGVEVDLETGKERAQCTYLYNTTAKKNGQSDDELGPEEVLALRRKRGKQNVVADASGLFDASFVVPGLLEHGCNMHARRYFHKALEAGDKRAALAIGAYKKLYEVEEACKGKPPAERVTARREKSKPVHDELIAWCKTHQLREPPQSLFAKAINYMVRHRVALTRYIEDGTVPMDNGIVERLHKRPALGRKAYMHAGSDAGANRAAVAYTVLGTCRLLELNAIDYLADVLPRLARGICIKTDLAALMPAAWIQAHPESRIRFHDVPKAA